MQIMKIAFITIAYPRNSSESNLYSDLMEEFAGNGHTVYVICSIEKRYGKETHLITESNGIKVLRVKTGNITSNPNYVTKGIALLQFQSQLIEGIKKNISNVLFDLILYSTPPIQYNKIIRYLRKKSNASTYLLLKDIFPQNAVDLGLLAKWNPVYWYFKQKEKETYQLSDFIGCMSQANVNYLKDNNPCLKTENIEVCPNSIKNRSVIGKEEKSNTRSQIRKLLAISEQDLLLIYGGNLGISQGIPFLLEIIKAYQYQPKVQFLIVGEGTWYTRIERCLKEGEYKNVIFQKRVSSSEFRKMLLAADLGLIFLNPKFTIPNFPSRLTSYLEVGLPVIACTDKASDIGDVVENVNCGFKVLSGDLKKFEEIIENILKSPDQLQIMSVKARDLFEKSYTTDISYSKIISHIS